MLGTAAKLETLILARLQARPHKPGEEARRAEVQNLIAGVDGLLRDEKAILKDTAARPPARRARSSDRQDQLADQSVKVRKEVEMSAGNLSLGDPALRAGFEKIAAMFGEFKIYEGMLTAADALGSKTFPKATDAGNSLVGAIVRRWSPCSARGSWPRRAIRPTRCAKPPRR